MSACASWCRPPPPGWPRGTRAKCSRRSPARTAPPSSSPSAMRLLEKAIDDADRDVRIAAVRFLGSRGYRNAASRIESMVTGSKLRNADLTEKMTFFEAFGAIVGAKGIPALEKMLASKGLLGRKEDPETRACAAMALGKVRTPEARAVLERAAQDKEPLVRNAVTRALREVGT